MTSALESQITSYLQQADTEFFKIQQRAIAATNAKPSPLNFLKAVFSDSIFAGSSMGPVKAGPKGIVKYGRHGEYILHIGVDEDVSLLRSFTIFRLIPNISFCAKSETFR